MYATCSSCLSTPPLNGQWINDKDLWIKMSGLQFLFAMESSTNTLCYFNPCTIRAATVFLLVLVLLNSTHFCSIVLLLAILVQIRVPITALIILGSMWLIIPILCLCPQAKLNLCIFTVGSPLYTQVESPVYVECYHEGCSFVAHVTCLAPQLCQEREQLIPVGGRCPRCDRELLWGELIKRCKRKKDKNRELQNVCHMQ